MIDRGDPTRLFHAHLVIELVADNPRQVPAKILERLGGVEDDVVELRFHREAVGCGPGADNPRSAAKRVRRAQAG